MLRRLAWILLCGALLMNPCALAEFDDAEFEFGDFADVGFAEDELDGDDWADTGLVEDDYTEEQLAAALEAGTFSINFDDGGYVGAWTSVDALNIEFFLPEGWTVGEAAEDEYFFAENADESVQLGIELYGASYDGEDLAGWAQENVFSDYSIGLANHQEVVLVIDNEIGQVLVLVPASEERVIAFSFFRTSVDAISDAMALEIAGTCTDLWA